MPALADHLTLRTTNGPARPIHDAGRAVPTLTLTHRDRALLTAVDAGRCHVVSASIPDLRIDGLWFCDQTRAHALMAAGLLTSTTDHSHGLMPARLTTAGRVALAADPP